MPMTMPPSINHLTATYGSPSAPLAFIISTSSPGYSGLLKPLCAQFIWRHGGDFRIGWVATDGHGYDDFSMEIGEDVGCVRLIEGGQRDCEGVRVGWDRFVLVGPAADPAGLREADGEETGVREALRRILHPPAEADLEGPSWKYFSLGPGSPSYALEQRFLENLGIDAKDQNHPRIETHPLPPLPFLHHVSSGHAYTLVQRSIFLTALRDGLVENLCVYVEGGRELLCPIYASVATPEPRTQDEESVEDRLARRFVHWLGEEPAQGIWSGYGRVWEVGMPLFTRRSREEIAVEEGLVGKEW